MHLQPEAEKNMTPALEPNNIDLSIEIEFKHGKNASGKRLLLKNPILPASGTFGYGEEFEPFVDPGIFAAVLGKSISIEVRSGNAPPRAIEADCGLINSIGLQNPGIDAFLESYLPKLCRYGAPVFVNIVGKSAEDYCQLAQKLEASPAAKIPPQDGGLAALELNVSCPNVKEGLQFGLEPKATGKLIQEVRSATSLPLMAKLTPNVTDIAEQAIAAQEAGADMLSLINTIRAMSLNWRTRKSNIGTQTGGLSGPAIRPIALRMVYEVAQAVNIPVCGIGGISKPEHVLEFMVAGASMVQVGTHLYGQPDCLVQWQEELKTLLAKEQIPAISQLIGSME